MIHPRYLAALVLCTVVWCGGILAFTWIIDPYGVSPIRFSWSHINKFKPKRLDIDRLIKPFEVWRYQPRTVYLGTSRIHQSIDPAILDGTRLAPAYNASIPASSLGLNVSHLRQYIKLDPNLRTVFVELFFYNFLGQRQDRARDTLAGFLQNMAALFFSADLLWASIQTLGYNLIVNAPHYEVKAGGYYYYPPGHDAQAPFDGFARGIWKLHETRNSFRLYEPAFDSLRELIEVGRRNDLEIVFILTPNHAYDDFYLESIGGWGAVEQWLARVSKEATVYSFSQPNDWLHEPVSASMRYWNDPYHFSLEMGRAMQLSLAGRRDHGAPANFMARMTPDRVRGHIERRREAIRRWAQANPEFVARFQEERARWEKTRNGKNDGKR